MSLIIDSIHPKIPNGLESRPLTSPLFALVFKNSTLPLPLTAFGIKECEHVVSFITKSLSSDNLFFKTELTFAIESDKDVFLIKTEDAPLPEWLMALDTNHEKVHIRDEMVLREPQDVSAHADVIFAFLEMKRYCLRR